MRTLLRGVAIMGWTLGAFWGWLLLVSGVLIGITKLGYRWSSPGQFDDVVILYGAYGCGCFIATVAALLLGVMGKLPGTRKKAADVRGFSVTMPTSGERGS